MFQSTLPVKGATYDTARDAFIAPFQSTLPAKGATVDARSGARAGLVSIHAPSEGSDPNIQVKIKLHHQILALLRTTGHLKLLREPGVQNIIGYYDGYFLRTPMHFDVRFGFAIKQLSSPPSHCCSMWISAHCLRQNRKC